MIAPERWTFSVNVQERPGTIRNDRRTFMNFHFNRECSWTFLNVQNVTYWMSGLYFQLFWGLPNDEGVVRSDGHRPQAAYIVHEGWQVDSIDDLHTVGQTFNSHNLYFWLAVSFLGSVHFKKLEGRTLKSWRNTKTDVHRRSLEDQKNSTLREFQLLKHVTVKWKKAFSLKEQQNPTFQREKPCFLVFGSLLGF